MRRSVEIDFEARTLRHDLQWSDARQPIGTGILFTQPSRVVDRDERGNLRSQVVTRVQGGRNESTMLTRDRERRTHARVLPTPWVIPTWGKALGTLHSARSCTFGRMIDLPRNWAKPALVECKRAPTPRSGLLSRSARVDGARPTTWEATMLFVLWLIAVVLVIWGIVTLVRGEPLVGIVLIVVGLLVGPGGVSVFA